jgi:YrbI family 3-deoxy-D-manno-octulosonate 8-phosphate phosphatase
MAAPAALGDLHAELRQLGLVVLDFDGVLTDNGVWVTQDGVESVRCSRSDGLGLARLRALSIPVVIVSTETNPVVGARARKLGLPCRQGVPDKRDEVLRLCAELGVDPGRTAFVGNDINDIPAFGCVGLPVAVADAYPEVLPHVRAVTSRPGGHGAVRELCDHIHAAHEESRT